MKAQAMKSSPMREIQPGPIYMTETRLERVLSENEPGVFNIIPVAQEFTRLVNPVIVNGIYPFRYTWFPAVRRSA